MIDFLFYTTHPQRSHLLYINKRAVPFRGGILQPCRAKFPGAFLKLFAFFSSIGLKQGAGPFFGRLVRSLQSHRIT